MTSIVDLIHIRRILSPFFLSFPFFLSSTPSLSISFRAFLLTDEGTAARRPGGSQLIIVSFLYFSICANTVSKALCEAAAVFQLNTSRPICRSVTLSVCLSVWLAIPYHVFLCVLATLRIYLSFYLSIYVSMYICTCVCDYVLVCIFCLCLCMFASIRSCMSF